MVTVEIKLTLEEILKIGKKKTEVELAEALKKKVVKIDKQPEK